MKTFISLIIFDKRIKYPSTAELDLSKTEKIIKLKDGLIDTVDQSTNVEVYDDEY